MNEFIYCGKAWKCLDDVGAEKIYPRWHEAIVKGVRDPGELGKTVMEAVDPNFAKEALEGKYKIIVAGKNFGGGGKSIPHPILAIKGAGIKAVVAESFARYFLRNAINNGLPSLICKGVTKLVEAGDELEVNLGTGEVKNLTKNQSLKTLPLPEFLLEILSEGGYIQYAQKQLEQQVNSAR